MSFIKTSRDAYKQVQENHIAIAMGKMLDDEGSMVLNQLEELERAIKMIRTYIGTDYEKQLPAWVQAKVTLGSDYISTVGNYLSGKNEKVTEEVDLNESLELLNELGSNAVLSRKSFSPAAATEVGKSIFLKTPRVSSKSDYTGDIRGSITNTQLANIKKTWANKTKNDLTPELLKFIAKLDLPTRVAIGQANINVLSNLVKEEVDLEETSLSSIHKMKEDGKTSEEIAKELKLNAGLVKKILGEEVKLEEIELKEFTDAMLAALKKEYDPLKGKTITTSQYQQLKNILFKLQDGDLEKLQKQNIPFASTGAGSILRARKSPVKITSVKVPGLEGMAEEKINEIDLQEKPSRKKHVVFKVGDKLVAKDFRGYNDDEIAKSIDDFLKQNSKSIVVQQSPIQSVTEEPKNPYAIGMAAAMKATGDTPPLKKSTITKAHKIADKVKEEKVSTEKETEFHKKLDTLVHKTFGKRKNEGARAIVEKAWKKLKEKNND
jgi:hypothetical protein